MPLVFLPDEGKLFAWGEASLPRELAALEALTRPHRAAVVTPDGRRDEDGAGLPLLETAAVLAAVSAATVEALPASFAIWTLASKLALELVAKERVIPTLTRAGDRIEAKWAAALSGSDESAKAAALSSSMPPAAHAVPLAPGDTGDGVWTPGALLRAYLDAVVDALIRESPAPAPRGAAKASSLSQRFRAALEGPERAFESRGFAERTVIDDVERWGEPAVGSEDRLRACFRLELPEKERAPFRLAFFLQSPDDPSLMVPASEVWEATGSHLQKLGRAFRDPQESLLEALGRATRLFEPLREALAAATPVALDLDAATAWSFLGEGAAALTQAGFGVIVPGELTPSGQRRLRLRMRVGGKSRKVAGAVSGAAGLGLDELIAVDWEAIVGDDALTLRELSALAEQKAPLVKFRGAWVAVDPRELQGIQNRLADGGSRVSTRDAVQAVLTGESTDGELAAKVVATGAFHDVMARLRNAASEDAPPPQGLLATLRPYQQRGLNWLWTLGTLGLGACLADDMGLGKTVQLLAFLARRREHSPADARPVLLVAPTSVLGNWEREIQRFSPSLHVVPHYGSSRGREASHLTAAPGALVLTSYGLLRRDATLLAAVEWSTVVLDEAQNIKNAASATARAARALPATHRFALTGTPVENRLAELWSILEFCNPGLLGNLEGFRRKFAIPIERYGDDDAAERLRRVSSPFVLRRLKSDPSIVRDLPPKNEMKVVCTLTREQATLYKAVVDEELRRIATAEGMERRGRVLALLAFTKQICNHPAQYLSESGPLERRSGKLARVTEMLEEALAAKDKALVFTQFKEMGDRLVTHLSAALGAEIAFLHGGTPKATRDALVRRFQDDPRGPRVFVLSLKAGGTGLNLTAASHVFHYDRWWNPAVEDQATDRAYRIGQKRTVHVYKLICSGTVEDKIDQLLSQKRKLAAKVVGQGEQWITELDTSALRELFALESGAAVATDDSPEAA